ncbi:uncharacterized protein LAESUDRAFT_729242 [Laetiporus sulphureus 93-53]|uniref:Aminoglycoside phosphotransferase domain-containing protein n=1 Tax=Laetiporus sulphureus 93-53 TaxID=1314785 RepID=A0A165CU47_9APHY|nr:uncharacterized protein LAESUDRAFT_729242 [Laetiporus sulphureus 93-53]KZT03437.1 hypothetical protein LAESUDRAFT_729242 [Laetiporus sulphureus 93-53]
MLTSHIKPLFPLEFPDGYPLQCSSVGKPSSALRRKFWFYVHEWLLKPLSGWYVRLCGVPAEPAIYPLPFGLILKSHHRVREQEGLAMNLARAMGVPAPRFLSFGSIDDPSVFPSLLMTRVPGMELEYLTDDQVDFDVLKDDLIKILTSMRSFASPWGDAVCGVDGGPLTGPLMPASPLPPSANEAGFQQAIRDVAAMTFTSKEQIFQRAVVATERFFSLPTHAIVFTHGDLNRHNIMVGVDGHISGIIDWEAAGWLPDYWEVSVIAFLPGRTWGQFMHKKVTAGVYAAEIMGHSEMFGLISGTLRW